MSLTDNINEMGDNMSDEEDEVTRGHAYFIIKPEELLAILRGNINFDINNFPDDVEVESIHNSPEHQGFLVVISSEELDITERGNEIPYYTIDGRWYYPDA